MITESGRAAWWALEAAAGAARREAGAALRTHGLTMAQFELLELLESMRCGCCGEGECRCPTSYLCQNDVSGRIACTKGNVSGLVQRLAAEGLISRDPDPADRRFNAVRITARGRAALFEARPAFAVAVERTVGSLDAGEVRMLTTLLRRLAGAAEDTADGRDT